MEVETVFSSEMMETLSRH